ncbi:hypothetical protein Ancab_036435 [Ancistrocladus abbreviatus]
MAEVASQATPSLSEQYLLPDEEKVSKSVEVTKVENPASVATEEVVPQAEEVVPQVEETPAAAAESTEAPAAAATESSEAPPVAAENSTEESAGAAEESTETNEQEESGNQEEGEESPEIKLETAPADFRFPTTNQTRHCFTRYIEYHRCIAAKGEGAPECDKFAKYYRSLCPGEWIDRWNEQRENGTFPGPL